jgi:hypothetical protein
VTKSTASLLLLLLLLLLLFLLLLILILLLILLLLRAVAHRPSVFKTTQWQQQIWRVTLPLLHCCPMPFQSQSFWSDACKNAVMNPLETKLQMLYAACGATMRCGFGCCDGLYVAISPRLSSNRCSRCSVVDFSNVCARADCRLLRQRSGGGHHVFHVAAHGRG